jgi:hypothetical protein
LVIGEFVILLAIRISYGEGGLSCQKISVLSACLVLRSPQGEERLGGEISCLSAGRRPAWFPLKKFCFYRSFSVALPFVSVIIKRQWLRDRHCEPAEGWRGNLGLQGRN